MDHVCRVDVSQSSRRIRELDNLSLRDLVKRQCTARLPTQWTIETITLPCTVEIAHAIMPYRCEGTNWVNRSSAFYNSLRNRKNKFASLSRLTLEQELKEFVFLNLQSRSYCSHHPLQGYIILVEFQFGRNKWEHVVESCNTTFINSQA